MTLNKTPLRTDAEMWADLNELGQSGAVFKWRNEGYRWSVMQRFINRSDENLRRIYNKEAKRLNYAPTGKLHQRMIYIMKRNGFPSSHEEIRNKWASLDMGADDVIKKYGNKILDYVSLEFDLPRRKSAVELRAIILLESIGYTVTSPDCKQEVIESLRNK